MAETAAYATDAARKRDRIKRALANPAYFMAVYFAPYDPRWPESDPVPDFGIDMLRFAVRTTFGVVMLPPEFMKTTLLSQGLPLWETVRSAALGELLLGMLLSEEEGMAANNLGVVRWHIEYNEHLRRDFSDDLGRPLLRKSGTQDVWRNDAFVIERPFPSKDPTWQAKGLDSSGIQGRRITRLRADDVITPKNAFSPAYRKRALELWDQEIETRLVAGAKALVCGNFQDPKDLLMTLSARNGWATFKRPALHRPDRPDLPPREKHADDPERSVETWPSVWPRERLAEIRHRTPQRYRRIYLLDASAERGDRLKIDWMTIIPPDETPILHCRYFLSLDPAPGGDTDDLDFFVVSILALHPDNRHLDICQSLAVRADTPRQVRLVGALHDRWQRVGRGVVKIVGAKQSLDAYFRGALVTGRNDLEGKILPVSIPGDKLTRLEGLGPYAESGWLRCWDPTWNTYTSDGADQHQELSLRDEWKEFPNGRHDDRLDGVDVGIRGVREHTGFGMEGEFELEVLA